MELTYQIFKIDKTEVCTPSTDYYADKNDWHKEDIQTLHLLHIVDTMEEAIDWLALLAIDATAWPGAKPANYTILPVYSF